MTSELSAFADAYRERMDALAATPPQPDAVDVIDRAIALDEESVPPGLRESVVDACRDDAVEEPAPELDVFSGALRDRIQAAATEREMKPVPIAPAGGRSKLWLVAAVSIAAAVVLALVLPRLGSVAERGTEERPLMGAERTATDRDAPQDTALHPTPKTPPRKRTAPPKPQPEDPVVVDAIEPPPSPAETKERPTTRELEARAHERWQAGDLAEAERLLRRIIRRAGRSRRGELAYGDLMAVARQRGGAGAQAAVWRNYLKKFPKGRFSDDARGGLCRRAAAHRRSQCWSRYLDDYPAGAHAAEAKRHVQP